MSNLLQENINTLKTAIRAMMGLSSDPEYADCSNWVKWTVSDLKKILLDQVAFEQAMKGGSTDADGSNESATNKDNNPNGQVYEALSTILTKSTTLSADAKTSLNSVIESLTTPSLLSAEIIQAYMDMFKDVLLEAEHDPKADQEARSKSHGIGIHSDTHMTKPSEWASLDDSEFADPVNYKYPIHDKAHADNAAARLAQNEGDYNPTELAKVKARITAAQNKFGDKNEPKTDEKTNVKESSIPVINPKTSSTPPGYVVLSEQVSILKESEGSTNGTAFDMVIIVEGLNKARKVRYPWDKLKESQAKIEGKSFYVDHNLGERSLSTKAGWWSDIREGQVVDGGVIKNAIIGRANVLENSGVPWLRPMIIESIQRGNPSAVGISILAVGKTKPVKENGEVFFEVTEIFDYASADAVGEAGAGGRPLNIVESVSGGLSNMEIKELLEGLTLDQITLARPDLVEEWNKLHASDPGDQGNLGTVLDMSANPILQEHQKQLDLLLRTNSANMVASVLSESSLALDIQAMIRAKIGDRVVDRSEVEGMVKEYKTVLAASITPDNFGSLGFLGYHIPTDHIEVGLEPRERVQLAADHFFGVDVPADKIGKFEKIRSFREFYIAVTGDTEIDGKYNPTKSILREALPGAANVVGGATVTMALLLGTSMNRAVVKMYQAQPKWWEPVVAKVELQNMKQQNRILLHTFGSLTERTTDGAEYTELAWGETQETYSPTEYGNVVPVGRRAIINDDLRKIQAIPQLLANSAVLTLNEYVSNLFTQNSGNGPTLTDAVQVFNAASHQGNRVTTALNRANLLAARRTLMKMLNQSSKRIGVVPRHLLVPIDLEDVAWEMRTSPLVPDSANNARNLIEDSNVGLSSHIVVPNFTDVNNWYLMADPSQIVSLEMGFLFGREVPELLSQEDPSSGMVFTNDVINYKVRWDFGGDWVDYRGALGAIVA